MARRILPGVNYIGIDPGARGGLARIEIRDSSTAVLYLLRMPRSMKAARNFIANSPSNTAIVMEKVGGFNRSGFHHVAFGLGRQVGRIEAVLDIEGRAFAEMLPKEWRALVGFQGRGKNLKDLVVAHATKQFPGVNFSGRAGAKAHDGIAEASLIALAALKTANPSFLRGAVRWLFCYE